MQTRDSQDSPPGDLDSDEAFGDWYHGRLKRRYGFESSSVLGPRGHGRSKPCVHTERARRVAERIQDSFPPTMRRQVEIVRMKQANAFIVPGRYLYVTAALMALLPSDDSISLVIGHELAHSELGHLMEFRKRAQWKDVPAGDLVFVLTYLAQRFVSSPENERDADAYGLDLALRAGYDGDLSLEAFAVLEESMRRVGRERSVVGPEAARRPIGDPFSAWKARAKVWLKERRTGYPAIQERRAALAERLAQHKDRGQAPLLLPGSLTSSLAANTGFLARRQAIDEELSGWTSDLAALSDELADTMEKPIACRLLAAVEGRAAGLEGRSAREVELALLALKAMPERIAALFRMAERAAEIRRFLSYDNPPQSALSELLALLFGHATASSPAVPACAGEPTPCASPGGESAVTPRKIVSRLADELHAARSTMDSVETVWSRWQPFLKECGEDLRLLREAHRAATVDGRGPLDALDARVTRLDRRITADPLAVGPAPDRDLRSDLNRACAQMREHVERRRELESRLSRADALFSIIGGRYPGDPAPDWLRLLSEELAALHAASSEGRLLAANEGLNAWLRSAAERISMAPGCESSEPPANGVENPGDGRTTTVPQQIFRP